jgi:hypothetical protein
LYFVVYSKDGLWWSISRIKDEICDFKNLSVIEINLMKKIEGEEEGVVVMMESPIVQVVGGASPEILCGSEVFFFWWSGFEPRTLHIFMHCPYQLSVQKDD